MPGSKTHSLFLISNSDFMILYCHMLDFPILSSVSWFVKAAVSELVVGGSYNIYPDVVLQPKLAKRCIYRQGGNKRPLELVTKTRCPHVVKTEMQNVAMFAAQCGQSLRTLCHQADAFS